MPYKNCESIEIILTSTKHFNKKKRINGKVVTNKETCPIFNKNSSTPKLKFDHQKPFGTKNAIDRNLLSVLVFSIWCSFKWLEF